MFLTWQNIMSWWWCGDIKDLTENYNNQTYFKNYNGSQLCDDVSVVGFCVTFNFYRTVFKAASLLRGSQV